MLRWMGILGLALAACSSPESGAPAAADASPAADAAGDPADAAPTFPSPLLDDCITDGSAGEHTFPCGNLSYEVSVPEACLERACGMVVDVHGYTMSGNMENANTRMRSLGREHGYIVVQPNADPAPPSSDWTALDDAVVLEFVERVASAFHVDEHRWYFTGFSQGGFMSWRFACKYADKFAAIAPLAGCAWGGVNACVMDQTDLPGETHILYGHGTKDTIVSGSCMGPQRDSVIAAYELTDPEVVSEDGNYTRTRWTNARGITFEMIEHHYASDNTLVAGHCFPGSDDPGTEPGQVASFACAGPDAFDWGTEVIEFFDAHTR